jgi:hypothetical protein
MQVWGYDTQRQSNTKTVTYPIAFTVAPFYFGLRSVRSTHAGGMYNLVKPGTAGTTSVTFYAIQDSDFYWFAIGK